MSSARRTSMAGRYRLSAFGIAGLVGILSCREDVTSPSGPEPTAATASLAQAPNTWIRRAAGPLGRVHDFSTAAAPNAAGQWFAYTFGGHNDEGRTQVHTTRYNVQTDTWSWQDINSLVEATAMNGVGKIGNKFYMTGATIVAFSTSRPGTHSGSTISVPTRRPGRRTCLEPPRLV